MYYALEDKNITYRTHCMYVCVHQIRQRVMQILSIRGGSIKAIKSIMRGETINFHAKFLYDF